MIKEPVMNDRVILKNKLIRKERGFDSSIFLTLLSVWFAVLLYEFEFPAKLFADIIF